MFDALGFGELAIIAILAIVVVGPDRLPEMLRFLGRQYGKLMRASTELRRAFMVEADRAEAERRAEALRKRREEARQRAEEARRQAMERAKSTQAGTAVPREIGPQPLEPAPAEAPAKAPPEPGPTAPEGEESAG